MPIIAQIVDLYSLVVLVAVVLSWFQLDPRNPLVSLVYGVTEPVLGPIRRLLPPMGGLDLSPMVLLFALQALGNMLRQVR